MCRGASIVAAVDAPRSPRPSHSGGTNDVSGCIDCCCLLTPPLSPLLSPNAHPLIREAVDGAVLAVDISEWIFQATVGLCYWGCVGAVTS